jgi:iron-sulfur cluster assembly protein
MEEAVQNTTQGFGAASSEAPSKREVHITAEAVKYAKKRLAARGTPDAAVRLGVRGGGCSGFNYVIEFSDEAPRAKDTVCELDGVKFYVDKKSLIYLAGSTLDYEHTLMFQGFRFRNPQEATRCGCGHSFTVR